MSRVWTRGSPGARELIIPSRLCVVTLALLLSSCSKPEQDEAPPGAVEQLANQMDDTEDARKADAIAGANARSDDRKRAAEERLEAIEKAPAPKSARP